MLIAHKCIKCHKGSVVYNFDDSENHSCQNCGYKEDELTFDKHTNYERYERELDAQIEDSFPYRDLFLTTNTITLAVGYHVTGRFADRDNCIEHVFSRAKELEEKWQICFCDFRNTKKTIQKYKDIKEHTKRTEKYRANIETVDAFFNDIPMYIKCIYKK